MKNRGNAAGSPSGVSGVAEKKKKVPLTENDKGMHREIRDQQAHMASMSPKNNNNAMMKDVRKGAHQQQQPMGHQRFGH